MAELPTNQELPTNRLRCPDCKAFRSISDFPFQHGFRKSTCTKCKNRRANYNKKKQERQWIQQQEADKDKEVFTGSFLMFCSSYTQRRLNTQFGRFSTCSFCRSTNTKSLRRKREITKPRYCTPTLQEIEEHLQEWVAIDGEQEVKLQRRNWQRIPSLLLGDLRRPLTVEDYLESSLTLPGHAVPELAEDYGTVQAI